MRLAISIVFILCQVAIAQQPTYYIRGLFRQPTDWQAREYLGITNGGITNLTLVTNLIRLMASNAVTVAEGTNVVVVTNSIGDTMVYTVHSTASGVSITMTTNNSPFTNNGMFTYFKWTTPSNTAPFLMRNSDGSHFFGRSLWADPLDWLHQPSQFPWYAHYYVQSNDNSVVEFGSEVEDTITPSIYHSKNWNAMGISGSSPFSLTQWYSSSNSGAIEHQVEVNVNPADVTLTISTNSFVVWKVNRNGDMVVLKGLSYLWPDAHANGALTNDGAGNLGWSTTCCGGGAPTIQSNYVVLSGTNISVTVTTTNYTNYYLINTIGELNNWAQITTNALLSFLDSNWWWTAYGSKVLTNAAQFIASDSGLGTNTSFYTSSYFYGPALSYSASASNAPAANEFPTAQWVRSLFNNGLILYVSTNIFTDATNTDEQHVVYEYTNQIPPTASRYYSTVNAGDYIGSVVATNRFTTLQGPILVKAFLQRTNGLGSPTVSLHPEFYYSTNRTNWQGDFSAQDQVISTGTNLYEWVISFPTITDTNGFWIERRFKIGTATGATHPDVVVHIGTNYLSGTNDAAHIALAGTASGTGGGGTGTTTVIVTNLGVLTTNVPYTTNQGIDISFMYNDYYQTNACTNHINVRITNLVQGALFSLSIQGATSYTNVNVYFNWPVSATVTWLSITNGLPVTTCTSNKTQYYSFLVRTNNTQTNVMAAFKEQP